MTTKELIHQTAMANGWTLVKDLGWSKEYHRGLERLSMYFGETSGALTMVTNYVPTGDVYAMGVLVGDSNPRPVYDVRGLDHRGKNKKEAALAWLAEPRYARPGINENLRKMGIEPILPDAPEVVTA